LLRSAGASGAANSTATTSTTSATTTTTPSSAAPAAARPQQEGKHANLVARLSRESILAAFCNAMDRMLVTFEDRGFVPFESEYMSKWMHSQQTVEVEVVSGASDGQAKPTASSSQAAAAASAAAGEADASKPTSASNEQRKAVVTGLTSSGYLKAVDAADASVTYELMPSHFSFDLSRALLARKTKHS